MFCHSSVIHVPFLHLISEKIRKSRFGDIARSGFLDLKKVEIRRSAVLDFLRLGRSGSGRDQEIKPPKIHGSTI